jgi:hypothetical protein
MLLQRATDAYFDAFKMAVTYLNPCNSTRLSVALNYTVFLVDLRNDQKRALNLSRITQELAMTKIDDSANPEKDFSKEEVALIIAIQHNITLWESMQPTRLPSLIM